MAMSPNPSQSRRSPANAPELSFTFLERHILSQNLIAICPARAEFRQSINIVGLRCGSSAQIQPGAIRFRFASRSFDLPSDLEFTKLSAFCPVHGLPGY